MKELKITVPASRDLNEISEYFLAQSLEAGDRFVQGFNQKCKNLARFPHIGKSYPHLMPGLRGLLLMNHIIFYRVSEQQIEILRVVSGFQDLQQIFSQN
ncbi:MAG: type II toxin-antitoxin system RelE/ParE family toxin [Cyanobacteria bacterium P01_G01_bin.54]